MPRLSVALLGALLAGAVATFSAHAQDTISGRISGASSSRAASHEPVTPAVIDKRLEDLVARTQQYAAKAARVALVDFVWAADPAEHRALAKFVVVLVVAVSHDQKELPLRRVYAYAKGREVTLQKLSSERSMVAADSPIHDVLGRYRENGFYLAPAGPMLREGELLVDFAVNRNGFRLRELPGETPDFVKLDRDSMPTRGGKPDPSALRAIIEREYPGFSLPAELR